MKKQFTIYGIALIIIVGILTRVPAFASFFDVIGLRNASGTQINPATSENQTTLNSSVDQLEGYLDGVEGSLTTISGDTTDIETAVEIMDDWDDADRAKISNRLIVDFYASTTVGTTATLVFDASAHTDTVCYRATNNDTAEVYLAPYAFLTVSDFQYYIPPYQQSDLICGAGNAGTADDLYAIHDTGDSGPVLIVGYKYK